MDILYVRRKFKHPVVLFGLGLVLGVLLVLVIRFATYSVPKSTHYHANFAVYLNGKREEFKDPKYYEEVAICSSGDGITIPQQRAHMHDEVNSVVHVHDSAVTWGQFFENLRWVIGPDFIETADGTMYRNNGNDQLHILINGQDYTGLGTIANMVIKDQSQLLVSYGDVSNASLKTEAATIGNKAKHYDESADPASCNTGDHEVTIKDRFKHLF
ncbi:MAG: hypothetical protein JWN38_810 [Candidatus Saccharibacteria bacterium]|nr:hypothetical protein [Candidatus Saccharibacteria bacterium]